MVFPGTQIDRRRFLGLTALASVAVTSPFVRRWGVNAQGTPAEQATPATSAIEEAITATMEELSIPGSNVLLDRPDSGTWSASFGVSDLGNKSPMRPAQHMRIGSITKTMTATVVLQLVDEGLFALHDTLATLLPDVTTIPNAEQITVRHLLSMRSGIFDYLDDNSFFPQVFADPTRPWALQEIVALAAKHDPEFAPGTDFAYSNTNYVLLGMIVEAHTNHPIADVLEGRLFTPLGMAHTSLPTTPELPEPFARGYSVDLSGQTNDLIDWTELNPTIAWAAGGVVSTIGDLNIWLRALVDGSLVSTSLQQERMAFKSVRPGYGYGLGIADYDGMVGHEGSILGYHSFAGYDASAQDTVIVLTNLDPAGEQDAATAIAEAIRGVLDGPG